MDRYSAANSAQFGAQRDCALESPAPMRERVCGRRIVHRNRAAARGPDNRRFILRNACARDPKDRIYEEWIALPAEKSSVPLRVSVPLW